MKPDIVMWGKYRQKRCPGHPFAYGKGAGKYEGYASEHRVLLWEHLHRPKKSPCRFCDYLLPWQVRNDGTVDQGDLSKYVIQVDHVNNDPLRNEIGNLKPVCWWCNMGRAWFPGKEPWVVAFRQMMLEQYRDIHPAQRPDEAQMCEARDRFWIQWHERVHRA